MATYVALIKRGYRAVSADDDEVTPDNLAALEKGLDARMAERARDFTRANQLWAEARMLLSEQSEDESGAAALGAVAVEDTFEMQSVSGCYD